MIFNLCITIKKINDLVHSHLYLGLKIFIYFDLASICNINTKI